MSSINHPFAGQRRTWNSSGNPFHIVSRIYEGQWAGQMLIRYDDDTEGIHTVTDLATNTFPADEAQEEPIVAGRIMPEPPAPHDDEHEHGDPLAATLSDRTIAKVLSRPAHVPSIVMLDRDAAAQRLADVVTDILRSPGLKERDPGAYDQTRQALADYRETTR